MNRALDAAMAAHERGEFRKVEVWVERGSFKVVGQQRWNWTEEDN